jgi:hypothetical protein
LGNSQKKLRKVLPLFCFLMLFLTEKILEMI